MMSNVSRPLTLVLLAIILLMALARNVKHVTSLTISRYEAMNNPSLENHDQKMRAAWPEFYDQVQFIRMNTDEQRPILHPPQVWPWHEIGNQLLLRSFLFPRKLVSTKEDVFYEKLAATDEAYVVISQGNPGTNPEHMFVGWPRHPVPFSIIYPHEVHSSYMKNSQLVAISHTGIEHVIPVPIEEITTADDGLETKRVAIDMDLTQFKTLRLTSFVSEKSKASLVFAGENTNKQLVYFEGSRNTLKETVEDITLDLNQARAVFQSMGVKPVQIHIQLTNKEMLPYLYSDGVGFFSKQTIDQSTDISADSLMQKVNYLLVHGNYEGVQESLALASKLNSDSTERLFSECYFLYVTRHTEKSKACFEQLSAKLHVSEERDIGTYWAKVLSQ